MQSLENNFFQVLRNNFSNRSSEFRKNVTLSTDAYRAPPYCPKVDVIRNANEGVILVVRGFQKLWYVHFKKHKYQKLYEWQDNDGVFLKQIPFTFNFAQEANGLSKPLFGFCSGLIACMDSKKKEIISFYNQDKKNKSVYKNAKVLFIRLLPQSNDPEFIVLFEDSTLMRYKLNAKSHNSEFMEKVKKFEQKISFDLSQNKFKPQRKSKKKHFLFSSYLEEEKQELNCFYAINRHPVDQNPAAYCKFNLLNISDLVVKRHPSFKQTILRHSSNDEDNMIIALTSRDGYLIIYALNTMKPLLSYKAPNGGFNTLCFSENCELIALSGPDEYITVLDLYTLSTLRCIGGHKAFVNRAIFHTIQVSTGRQDQDQEIEEAKGMDTCQETRRKSWMRIIGGGMDCLLSFWEFRTDIFGSGRAEIEESQLPLRLHSVKCFSIKPIHLEMLSNAIGWIEITDDMLLACKYDGKIAYYQIKNF